MRIRSLAFPVLLLPLLLCGPAQADEKELGLRLKNCKAISSLMSRAQCYDSVVVDFDLENLNRLDVGEGTGKWKVTAETSRVTGTMDYFATVISDDYIRNKQGKFNRPSLVLRCADHKMESYVVWDEILGQTTVMIEARIGEGDTISGHWNLSGDKQASFIPEAAAFAKKLSGQTRFTVKVWAPSMDPLIATFDLRGNDVALKPLIDACQE